MRRTSLLERELAAILERRMRDAGARWYHTYSSRRSPEGWPDYAVVVGRTLLLAELKQAGHGPTPAQATWLVELAAAGVPAFLVAGVAGVDAFASIVEGIAKGHRLMPAAFGRVVVLGDVSDAGRLAVGAADGHPGDAGPAADGPTRPGRRRPGTRRPPRGS